MGLAYNTTTAVEKPFINQYEEETTYLNDNLISRDIELQNERYLLTLSGVGSSNTTLTEDIILTNVNFSASYECLVNEAQLNSSFSINSVLVDLFTMVVDRTIEEYGFGQKSVSFPNWLLRKGTIINLSSSVNNEANEIILISVIGYKLH